jgi:hypothetical protein
MEEDIYEDDFNNSYYDDWDSDNDDWNDDNEDMTGCCEDAPRACNHCSNYGCNAHPCN